VLVLRAIQVPGAYAPEDASAASHGGSSRTGVPFGRRTESRLRSVTLREALDNVLGTAPEQFVAAWAVSGATFSAGPNTASRRKRRTRRRSHSLLYCLQTVSWFSSAPRLDAELTALSRQACAGIRRLALSIAGMTFGSRSSLD
jgi:hypothetical protein